MDVGRLVAHLSLDTSQFQAGAAAAEGRLKALNRRVGDIGVTLTKSLTLPLALVGGAAAKMASDFDREMTKIETLVGVQPKLVNEWRDSLLDLAPAVGKGPEELAKSLFVVTSAGIRGADALKVVESAAKASAIGLGDTALIARTVTSAVQAWGKESLSAKRATEILVATVREGNLEAASLAGSLGRVLGVASELGVTFEQVGAFVATFTRLGVSAEEAVTALRSSLVGMLRPGKQAGLALAEVGKTSEGLRKSIGEKGLAATLIDLAVAFEDNVEGLVKVIPNVRALAGILGVASAQADSFLQIQESINNSTGILDEAFQRVTQTSSFMFSALASGVKSVAVRIGDVLLPGLLKITAVMLLLTDAMGKAQTETVKMAVSVALLAAALGPVTFVASKLVTAFGWIATQTGKLLKPFTLLGAGAILFSKKILNLTKALARFTIVDVVIGFFIRFKAVLVRVAGSAARFGAVIAGIAVVLKTALGIAVAVAIGALTLLGLAFTDTGESIRNFLAGIPKIGPSIERGLNAATEALLETLQAWARAFQKWIFAVETALADFFGNLRKWFAGLDLEFAGFLDAAADKAKKLPLIGEALAEGLEAWSEAVRTKATANLEDMTNTVEQRLQGLIDALGRMKLDESVASSLRLQKLQEAIKDTADESSTLEQKLSKVHEALQEFIAGTIPELPISEAMQEARDQVISSFKEMGEAISLAKFPEAQRQVEEVGREIEDLGVKAAGRPLEEFVDDVVAGQRFVREFANQLERAGIVLPDLDDMTPSQAIQAIADAARDAASELQQLTSPAETDVEAFFERLNRQIDEGHMTRYERATASARKELLRLAQAVYAINGDMDEFNEILKQGGDLIDQIGDNAEKASKKLQRVNLGKAIAGGVREMVTGVLRGTRELGDAFEIMGDVVIGVVGEWIAKVIELKLKELDIPLTKNIEDTSKKMNEEMASAQDQLAQTSNWEKITDAAGHAWEGLTSGLSSALTAMTGLLSGWGETLKGWVGVILRNFSDLAGQISGFLGPILSGAGGALGGFGGALLTGAKAIFGFAEGGLVQSPTLAIVGEAGPEIIVPVEKLAPLLAELQDSLQTRQPKALDQALRDLPAFAKGGYVDTPTLGLIGETPEIIIPVDKLEDLLRTASGVGGPPMPRTVASPVQREVPGASFAPRAEDMQLDVPTLPQLTVGPISTIEIEAPPSIPIDAPERIQFAEVPRIPPLQVDLPRFLPLGPAPFIDMDFPESIPVQSIPPVQVDLPDFPILQVDMPNLEIESVPPVEMRVPKLPKVDVRVPKVEVEPVSKVDVEMTVPEVPELVAPDLPALAVPDLPDLVPPDLPKLTAPELPALKAPDLPALEAPDLPELTTPELPALEVPDLPALEAPALPALEVPDLPALEAPDIQQLVSPEIRQLAPPDLPQLAPPGMPVLPEMPELTPPEIAQLVAPEIPQLTPPEIAQLTPPEIPELVPPELPQLAPPQMPALAQLPPVQFAEAPELKLDALSVDMPEPSTAASAEPAPIQVQIFNSTGAQVRVLEDRGPNNEQQLKILVGRIMQEDLARNGPVTRGFAQTFGAARVGKAR
jgi:TP901 family phage tail tape measure protein